VHVGPQANHEGLFCLCDVFEMRAGKIRKLISYLMEIKPA
jgi:hypothetical protein